ncbi:uncharacterized protein G2W53_001376 [Senna tora]|uniref:Uncharacterized protein n=1 Tax=Senna tora TaxID=362788 RepID=A0A835CK96_9FABA|nr:uncharacterized protein G2W53_001376 [Senna tora]
MEHRAHRIAKMRVDLVDYEALDQESFLNLCR